MPAVKLMPSSIVGALSQVFEIVTFGNDPYDGITNQEVVKKVCDGNVRLPCPTADTGAEKGPFF
jgi:hypothetical protein